jgi:small redox-active disulfide protein 1
MAEIKIEVFTSPTCPHCPAAVKATEMLVEQNPDLAEKIKWKEMSTASEEGSKKARSYGIRGVPTIVVTNEKGEKTAYVGAPKQDTYKKLIEEATK